MTFDSRTEKFTIPGVLAFDEPHAGMVRARITAPACTAELYLQGAHLTHWQPTGGEPVLFLSERSKFAPGQPIRGGVPLIFPWFGAPATSPIHPPADAPMHGFARTQNWQIAFAGLAGDDLHLTLTLGPTEISRGLGYDHFQLAYTLILGAELRLQLTVANQSGAPLPFEEAMHTYLAVGDASKVAIAGLTGTEYLDKTDGFKRKLQTESPLRLTGETDRPYLNTEAHLHLTDPVLHRRLTVAKVHSRTTVIWNPWSTLSAKLPDMSPEGWRHMTCVETANAAEDAVTLAPHETHTMEARITVEPSYA